MNNSTPRQIYRATDVFTPNGFPTHTYVPRLERGFDRQVHTALMMPNICVSVAGPSKSGKTVLLQNAVGADNIIRIFGAQIQHGAHLWDLVLDWLNEPQTSTTSQSDATTDTFGGSASLAVGAKDLFQLTAQGSGQRAIGKTRVDSSTQGRRGLTGVASILANTERVVFIDDFHYMNRQLQADVSKQIKAALELGVKIAVASVPHRSDDVVRGNPELRGRVQAIDLDFWTEAELRQIASAGFPLLDLGIADEWATRMAREACGSPQIMQTLCLQLCFQFDTHQTNDPSKIIEFDNDTFVRILDLTSSMADFSTMVEKMHEGPKTRGTVRAKFKLIDGTEGDVYRCVLLAISRDPPVMSIPYSSLMSRVSAVCKNTPPVGSSVSEACQQIDKIAGQIGTGTGEGINQKALEWDKPGDVETMHIADPYFMFYLRASSKLKVLGGLRS